MSKFWTIVIVVIVLAGAWWFLSKGGTQSPFVLTSSSPTATASPTKAPVARKTATPVPTQSLTYSQLVANYGSNRIQFDSNCQAQPKSVVFKNGTGILLDNRANQTETVNIDGKSYTLGPYGYREIVLSSPVLPATLTVSCNNLVNVSTIQLKANISGQ